MFFYYQKLKFGITNTKLDISFAVFRESFLGDQYRIKNFAGNLDGADSLLFLDIGRNHGFVFYYFLHHLSQNNIRIDRIQYIGIDPSPLKFVYYRGLRDGTAISYRIIDKAVVFDESKTVMLKYGERNLGNFNVTGSNFETRMKSAARQRDFIEIEVETISITEVNDLVRQAHAYSNVIVKIDCKNRTEIIMENALDILQDHPGAWLVACEADRSSEGRLKAKAQNLGVTLVASNRAI